MRFSSLHLLGFTFCCLIIAGCQSSSPSRSGNARATQDEQINQLASLVAAGKYLRTQCNRSDLPDDNTLMRGALRQGEKKGWDVSGFQMLPPLSDTLYEGLLKDGTPKDQQCSAFNLSVSPFLSAIRG
ncbi:type II secretion system pilot lipoprotein GspS [Lonsdalea quercina]|uniref:type II secretion system pilot lipoprotein GspS n=1 Tax=Lonsdalea quercina TaxID=71657 RepID=UPI003976038D